VCNGCTDDSASIARRYPGVLVEELDAPSKPSALNCGERLAGDAFPRLYVDADVTFEPGALARLVDPLRRSEVVAVAPAVRYLTDGTGWLVRSYYYGIVAMPRRAAWRATHLAGRGVYGTNRAGRTRFGSFPELRADDAYFDSQFGEAERCVVTDAVVGVHVPRTTRELVRNIARVRAANRELSARLDEQPCRSSTSPVDTALSARVVRTVDAWRRSPLVRDFQGMATVTRLVGFGVVRTLALAYRLWLAVNDRDAAWR
jgi:hypothetical protein